MHGKHVFNTSQGTQRMLMHGNAYFQHLPRNPANVNAGNHGRSLLLHKCIGVKTILERYFGALFWHYFVLIFLRTQMISIDILVPGSSDINTSHRKQLLNHGGKLARIHHVVDEVTKCSGCLAFILIVDNGLYPTK